MPISYSGHRERVHRTMRAISQRLVAKLRQMGVLREEHKEFANYAAWIRLEPARSIFRKLLCSEDALYQDYIPKAEVCSAFERHLAGADQSTMLCRYLTIELWLQQVFKQRYRDGIDCSSFL